MSKINAQHAPIRNHWNESATSPFENQGSGPQLQSNSANKKGFFKSIGDFFGKLFSKKNQQVGSTKIAQQQWAVEPAFSLPVKPKRTSPTTYAKRSAPTSSPSSQQKQSMVAEFSTCENKSQQMGLAVCNGSEELQSHFESKFKEEYVPENFAFLKWSHQNLPALSADSGEYNLTAPFPKEDAVDLFVDFIAADSDYELNLRFADRKEATTAFHDVYPGLKKADTQLKAAERNYKRRGQTLEQTIQSATLRNVAKKNMENAIANARKQTVTPTQAKRLVNVLVKCNDVVERLSQDIVTRGINELSK